MAAPSLTTTLGSTGSAGVSASARASASALTMSDSLLSNNHQAVVSLRGGVTLTRNTVTGSAQRDHLDGFRIDAPTQHGTVLAENSVHNVGATGIYVRSDGFDITSNTVDGARVGFDLADPDPGTASRSINNLASNNRTAGFIVDHFGEHSGNTAMGTLDPTRETGVGILAHENFMGIVRDAVVRENEIGVELWSGTLDASAIYGNTLDGVSIAYGMARSNREAWFGPVAVTGSSIHSNGTGVAERRGALADVRNLADTSRMDSSATIANNLIYNNSGPGVFIGNWNRHGNAWTVLLGNTVVSTGANAVELGAVTRNVELRNNILTVEGAGNAALAVAMNVQHELVSDYNLFHTRSDAHVAVWRTPFESLTAWMFELDLDWHSLQADPLFVNPGGPDGIIGFQAGITDGSDDNFHLRSLAGSYHGGAWLPDGSHSPAIDAGDPGTIHTGEASPPTIAATDSRAEQTGRRINLGAYGNTDRASRSPESVITLISPIGNERFDLGQIISIAWRTQLVGSVEFVDIAFSADGGVTWQPIAENIADTGTFNWRAPDATSRGLVRVTDSADPAVGAVSRSTFIVAAPVSEYFVNDTVADPGEEFTSAPGAYDHTGRSPDSPLPSINALLHTTSMNPGDRIWIDHGSYLAHRDIVIAETWTGAVIQGPANGVAAIDRGDRSPGTSVIRIEADSVTLNHLELRGADTGIRIDPGANGTRITNLSALDNADGLHAEIDGDLTVIDNRFEGNHGYGAFIAANGSAVVSGNTAIRNQTGYHFESRSSGTVSDFTDNIATDNTTGFIVAGYTASRNNIAHGNEVGAVVRLDPETEMIGFVAAGNVTGVLVESGTLRDAWIYAN